MRTYVKNPNRFGTGYYCKEHNMVFDIRCTDCFREGIKICMEVEYMAEGDVLGKVSQN